MKDIGTSENGNFIVELTPSEYNFIGQRESIMMELEEYHELHEAVGAIEMADDLLDLDMLKPPKKKSRPKPSASRASCASQKPPPAKKPNGNGKKNGNGKIEYPAVFKVFDEHKDEILAMGTKAQMAIKIAKLYGEPIGSDVLSKAFSYIGIDYDRRLCGIMLCDSRAGYFKRVGHGTYVPC